MFGLIGTVIVGFIVGVIAKLVMPGKENMGFIMTTVLGIVGSLVASYAGQLIGWYQAGEGAGWISSIVGAFALLWVYLRVKSNP
jgi:uncharacterized membrane protein YeaQ/YmgE (transglycosylase-associated protein family)